MGSRDRNLRGEVVHSTVNGYDIDGDGVGEIDMVRVKERRALDRRIASDQYRIV